MELYALRNLILYILVNADEKLNAWSGNIILYHITEIVLGYIIWIFWGGYLMQTLHSSSIKETHLQGDHGPWWHHQIEIYSASLALCGRNPPVTIGFPSQRPATRIFKVFFFDLRLSIRSSKQPRRWWFETPWCSLWRYCYAMKTLSFRRIDATAPAVAFRLFCINSLRMGDAYIRQ